MRIIYNNVFLGTLEHCGKEVRVLWLKGRRFTMQQWYYYIHFGYCCHIGWAHIRRTSNEAKKKQQRAMYGI